MFQVPLELARITDPASGELWEIDVQWLLSTWHCIYGNGCKGSHGVPDRGCCTIGAHFNDPEDLARVTAVVEMMEDSEFSNAREVRKKWAVRWGKERMKTRIIGDVCIFMNTEDHPNGAGCALHQGALKRGLPYQDFKPLVCSWAPMFVLLELSDEADPSVLFNRLTRFENHFWNEDGYEFNDWWCLDDAIAYDTTPGAARVYQHMEKELRSYLGDPLYEAIAKYLDDRVDGVPVTIGMRHGDGIPERLKEAWDD